MNYTAVISADRLIDIPTDELEYLVERFHELTVRMYDELCTRNTAEQGTAQVEAMLRARDQDTS